MPIFDIQCSNEECKEVKEVMLKSSSSTLPKCDKCGSETKRILSACKGFLMLGEGSYINGYKVFGNDKR